MVRNFIDLQDISAVDLRLILDMAVDFKKNRNSHAKALQGKSVAMIFEKNSTRTRISFEVGIHEMGGNPIVLLANDLQLGRGETIADTARVISRYASMIMMRTVSHEKLIELAAYASVPIINGLSDMSHPCQIMADLMTTKERLGRLDGVKIAWIGDGNNVLHSFISAASQFDYELHIACPNALRPSDIYVSHALKSGALIKFHDDPIDAATGANVIVTDTWVSMGHENSETRRRLLSPYQVSDDIMALASNDAIFLHCLPAHRGEEVTESVIDGPRSAVWDEAENRLHVQKAIMSWCLGDYI